MSKCAKVAPAENRKLCQSVYLSSASEVPAVYEPVAFPVRKVVSLLNSRSPCAPMSLPSVNPNRCSLSTLSSALAEDAPRDDAPRTVIRLSAAIIVGREHLPGTGKPVQGQICPSM